MLKRNPLKNLYIWYRERYFWHLKKKSIKEIFTGVYKNNEWGGEKGSFYSGEGTHSAGAAVYIKQLVAFIKEKQIRTILDIGCGDFSIMSKVLAAVKVNYTGADVVDEMIRHHQAAYRNDYTRFVVLDAIEDKLPDAELVIIRQVLQHLSNSQIQRILHKLSRYRYVLISEHILTTGNVIPNIDKIPGPHIRTRVFSSVMIDQPPFNIKNARVLFEYASDEQIKSRIYPAVIRTYLLAHQENKTTSASPSRH